MATKRGITPIIAIILLLMMTVAIGGAMFYWLTRIQGQTQGGVESFEGRLFENIASHVNVVDADYTNSTNENLTIFFQNTGNKKIPIANRSVFPTTTWILKDSDTVAVCSGDWSGGGTTARCASGCNATTNIDIGEIKAVTLNTAGTACDITSYGGGRIFFFTVDFSGEASASGSFIVPENL